MPTTKTWPNRLERLLSHIELDAANLVLRKDAIREACDTGEWDIARRLIDNGLLVNPGEPWLLAFRGYAHLQAQRFSEAEQALRGALIAGVDALEVRYNLAFALFMQKRHEDALELLEREAARSLPLALMLRARCLHHLGRRAEAISDCVGLLAVASDDADTNGLLALLLYEEAQPEAAARHAEAALSRSSNQLEAMLATALMLSDRRDYDRARVSFEALLEAHPQCGRGWLGLALMELARRNLDGARHAIQLAVACMPEHLGTWHVLAWTELMRADLGAAEAAFQRALALDRNFGESHGGLAVIAALQGREEEARDGIKRARRLNSESMSDRYAEMLLLQHHGRLREASELLESVLAQPIANGAMQYRDLVLLHQRHVAALESAEPATPIVLH
jgi:tetratricopeptide (TPR) repeat protein